MEKYVCIHGHFYQPPRENPWLEAIEQQDSAYPYHDWNERITEECYASNAAARILNEKKQIIKIVNNYAKISFNFGPTLLSWLAEKFPGVYQAILQADQESQKRLEGHGNAISQSYNHSILPLCNSQDKYTQIYWGIYDFKYRFKRDPEALWMPETAVDLESLSIMADQGIKFTILAQRQAKQFRKIGSEAWQNVNEGQIDPSMPYLLHLPKGRSIVIFFYDGALSQQVAFSSILNKGENFADQLMNIFSDKRNHPQLANIATDGETYGHHHAHGDMALAYALDYIEKNNLAKISNYSQFLSMYPPTHEVEIIDNSSWSCIHGIERWRSACGCNTGGQKGWNQNWRAPLRQALDWLRDNLIPVYEEKGQNFFNDPWKARNNYIEVILDRSPESLKNFFDKNARHPLNDLEQQSALCLLEMQRQAMLMYTSCGWFFDELSGIETVQVINYAARAIQLSEKFFDNALEKQFIEKLTLAKSNVKNLGDGGNIYEKLIKPTILDWGRIGAHYAVSHLFKNYEQKTQIYCYEVILEDSQQATNGNLQISMGQGQFKSIITTESTHLTFTTLHFGDQNINCGVVESRKILNYSQIVELFNEAFERGDLVAVNNYLIRYFGESTYSIGSLFKDEQRWILNRILENTIREVETAYIQLFQRHIGLMRFIENLNIPLPESLKATAEHVLNAEINAALNKEKIKVIHIFKLLKDAELAKIKLNKVEISFTLKNNLEKMMLRFQEDPKSAVNLEHVINALKIAGALPFPINLFKVQNIFYDLLQNVYPQIKSAKETGDQEATSLLEKFSIVGNQLSVSL